MLTHQVMLSFKNQANGRSRMENIVQVRDRIRQIEPDSAYCQGIEVVLDENNRPENYDLVIITTHRNEVELTQFLNKKEVLEVQELIKEVCDNEARIDFCRSKIA